MSTPDWAAALAALADEAGGDPLRSSICSAGLASSVGSGVSASSVGGFGRQRLLPTEVRDQADRVAQVRRGAGTVLDASGCFWLAVPGAEL